GAGWVQIVVAVLAAAVVTACNADPRAVNVVTTVDGASCQVTDGSRISVSCSVTVVASVTSENSSTVDCLPIEGPIALPALIGELSALDLGTIDTGSHLRVEIYDRQDCDSLAEPQSLLLSGESA